MLRLAVPPISTALWGGRTPVGSAGLRSKGCGQALLQQNPKTGVQGWPRTAAVASPAQGVEMSELRGPQGSGGEPLRLRPLRTLPCASPGLVLNRDRRITWVSAAVLQLLPGLPAARCWF